MYIPTYSTQSLSSDTFGMSVIANPSNYGHFFFFFCLTLSPGNSILIYSECPLFGINLATIIIRAQFIVNEYFKILHNILIR